MGYRKDENDKVVRIDDTGIAAMRVGAFEALLAGAAWIVLGVGLHLVGQRVLGELK
jgi:hypothetical protein